MGGFSRTGVCRTGTSRPHARIAGPHPHCSAAPARRRRTRMAAPHPHSGAAPARRRRTYLGQDACAGATVLARPVGRVCRRESACASAGHVGDGGRADSHDGVAPARQGRTSDVAPTQAPGRVCGRHSACAGRWEPVRRRESACASRPNRRWGPGGLARWGRTRAAAPHPHGDAAPHGCAARPRRRCTRRAALHPHGRAAQALLRWHKRQDACAGAIVLARTGGTRVPPRECLCGRRPRRKVGT
jgi:hypothetical protein